MCIMDRSYPPDNKNILLINNSKGMRPAYGMVISSKGIPVVDFVHESASKIMVASKYSSTMIHEYVPTSILLHFLLILSAILCASV